ncbi:MAG TPA: anthranilate phosphoribosyltransferase [Caulobacteraceae bacterium]
MSDAFKPLLAKLADGATLNQESAQTFFAACLRGEPSPAQVAAAVTAMRMRGETIGEIVACARAMREAGLKFEHPFQVIDTCGTGGDGAQTLNISTAAALVLAGGEVKVAKHGTRAVSSSTGSSDVLKALGVNVEASPAQSLKALAEANICFLYAPAYHGAMRHVLPIRQELGFRTIFNLLGPLSNPAGARRQVLGVYDVRLVEPMARALGELGAEHAWVVHGMGMDELTNTGPSQVAEIKDGQVRLFTVTCEEAGVQRGSLGELKGRDAETNAKAVRAALSGRRSAYHEAVVLNAAAGFLVAGKAETLRDGVALARASISGGGALASLDKLVEVTNAPA